MHQSDLHFHDIQYQYQAVFTLQTKWFSQDLTRRNLSHSSTTLRQLSTLIWELQVKLRLPTFANEHAEPAVLPYGVDFVTVLVSLLARVLSKWGLPNSIRYGNFSFYSVGLLAEDDRLGLWPSDFAFVPSPF